MDPSRSATPDQFKRLNEGREARRSDDLTGCDPKDQIVIEESLTPLVYAKMLQVARNDSDKQLINDVLKELIGAYQLEKGKREHLGGELAKADEKISKQEITIRKHEVAISQLEAEVMKLQNQKQRMQRMLNQKQKALEENGISVSPLRNTSVSPVRDTDSKLRDGRESGLKRNFFRFQPSQHLKNVAIDVAQKIDPKA